MTLNSVTRVPGTWQTTYNAENRPVRFENAGTQTVVECGYDSQGRRFEKKVTVAGTTTLHHRYIYRGYLQIAALDLTRAAHPALWLVTWDPSQSTATRPLALQKDGTWFTYGYDITKNVCELFGPNGYIRTAYSYTPFGSVSASENGVVQNFQWSSEYYDSELDLVYYNYRHYSPAHGRFLSRDPIAEQGGLNLYTFVGNKPILKWDLFGSAIPQLGAGPDVEPVKPTASLDSLIPASWNTALGDLITWLNGNHPQISYYGPDSAETQDLIKSEIARKLRTEFLKKNQGRKCSNWEDYTGAGMDFGIVRFILDIPNGRAHFVGSGDGDVYISVDEEKSLITAYFSIRNVTSMQSLMYHLWFIENIEEAGLPRSNWTQIYSWEETYACKKC